MRILIIYQHFLSQGEPGFSRLNEYSGRWARDGFNVSVIASQVNYMTGRKAFLGGNPFINRCMLDNGIEVLRAYIPSAYQKSVIKKIASLGVFTISSIIASLYAKKPNVILISSPPIFLVIPALILSCLYKIPFVFDIRDLWPETGYGIGVLKRGSALGRILEKLEMIAARRACAINALTPAFRDDLISRGLAHERKISVIPNGIDFNKISLDAKDAVAFRKNLGWEGYFVVVYTGAHGLANFLELLVEAAARLETLPGVLICSFGDGLCLSSLREKVRRRGLKNIHFYGAVSKDDAHKAIMASDICTAVLKKAPAFNKVYPNKIIEYMALSKPIIVSIDGIARKLVEAAGAGLFSPPEDVEAFVKAVHQLKKSPDVRAKMGKNGREFAEKYFSIEPHYQKMTKLLQKVARL